MNKLFKGAIVFAISFLLLGLALPSKSYAYSDIPAYFDFQDSVISINAGESKTMTLRANYNYTYYLGAHTSSRTYLECSFKSGTQKVTFHIGPDEQEKNVFFHFYVDDPLVESTDTHDSVEVYVQNISANAAAPAATPAPSKSDAPATGSVPVTLSKGKTGSASQNDKIVMVYNKDGVGMASFSLSNGPGQMATLNLKGVVENNGAKYFDVTSETDSTPVISESDKGVMTKNGYAGVCVNGKYKNWP